MSDESYLQSAAATRADLADLVRRHLTAENAHDLDGTLATLHEQCVFRDHATGQAWKGKSGAADHYRHWWRAFDLTVTRGEGQGAWWGGDDTYVAQATWRGRHIGEFLGVAPTGTSIVHPFVVFVTFRDGLMAGEEFFYDLASLLKQLGSDRLPELARLSHR